MKQIFLTLATVSLLLGGCTKSETEVLNPDEMRFTATYPTATRATGTALKKTMR